MTLLIEKPGPLASVQDLGRHGHRQLGICPGGALAALGLALGLALPAGSALGHGDVHPQPVTPTASRRCAPRGPPRTPTPTTSTPSGSAPRPSTRTAPAATASH